MRRLAVLVGVIAALTGGATAALAEAAPVAVDDYAESDGSTVQIYVLANDGGDFDPGTLSLVSDPSQGKANVISTGAPRIKYSGGSQGGDTFQYSICNSAGACSIATVTVNIISATTNTGAPPPTTAPATTTTVAASPPTTTSIAVAPPTSNTTTSPPPSTTTTFGAATVTTSPSSTTTSIDPLATLAAGEHQQAAGTTIGEPRGFRLEEDFRFLGKSSAETLKLVAVPAVMVSGIIGFLLVGLPQNALGGLLGFLLAWRRRREEDEPQPQT